MNLLTYYFIFIQSYYYSLFYLCIVPYVYRSFNKHWWLMKCIGYMYFTHKGGLLFPERRSN